MSYLHIPRLCIDGTFEAGGVTANNVLAALPVVNTPAFKPPPADRNWHNNNYASNQFSVSGSCSRVISAWDKDGPVTSDAVIGASFSGDGVMADLDPEHRRVTDLFGFQLAIAFGAQQEPLLRGTLRPTQLRDFWVVGVVDGDAMGVSTNWQSVMDGPTWSQDISRSKVLSQLREVSGSRLSVRLTMTHYTVPNYETRFGKLIAVIGPYQEGEPEQIVPGRRLTSPRGKSPGYPGFPVVSFLVDERRSKLVMDLCNLVPSSLKTGTGLLTGLTAKVDGRVIGKPRDLSVHDWLTSAGLVEWDLKAEEQALLAAKPLRLEFTLQGAPAASVMDEQPEGKYVDVDQRRIRMDPGETATIAIFARKFNKPLPNENIRFDLKQQLALDPIKSLQIQPGDPYYPQDPSAKINSEPADIFDPAPPFVVKTDAQGRAELKLKLKPGPFTFPALRKCIDSQLYFLGDPDGWQDWGALGPPVGARCALTVLVFNKRDIPKCPTWKDVSGILERYARLYPFMKQVIDLASENAVRASAYRLRLRLKAAIETVQSMPITRDLSASDRELIVQYLDSIIRKHQGLPSP
jgi:hypothetical protein